MAHEHGLLHEGVYVLPYCYRCETTMANYELEYGDESDPSIYIKFKVKGKENEYLIVWTTTPWTLVANMGVMVHPTFSYVKAKVDGEIWIIAKDRLDHLMGLIGKSAVIIEELPGRKLNDIEYEHPFQDKIHKFYERKVVLSDEFVTLEDGTGLVHTAPGHGPADFIIGKRYGIEAFCPVDGKGNYTEDAGHFAGKNVREANPLVNEVLNNLGVMVYEARIRHRYPHCWRCKTPLIFLTTKQWFITISKMKDHMLAEVEKTEWHPDFAKERFKEFVSNAPDWCISRQRYWGIPLPIWKCECGKIKVVGSRNELPKVKELHRPYLDEVALTCECGKKMKRISDVLDVWFDSGNAIWASLSSEEAKRYTERADLIIEGQDQIRGWFYSLLGSGIVRYGSCPYKRIMMHGFFVDEKGEKMSKSVGNFVPLEEILDKYGADSFRLWGVSNTVWEELKFSWDELKKATAELNIFFNMIVFLERFHPNRLVAKPKLTKLDEWMMSRLHSTIREFRSCFDSYEINRAAKALRSFVVDDVSRFYMKIAKDRISSGEDADGALWTIYSVMLTSLKMLGCISPMLSEYLYLRFFKKFEKEESLFLLTFSPEDAGVINTIYEKQLESVKEIVSIGLVARQAAGIKVRWPIRTLHIETKSHEVTEAAKAFEDTILALMNAKSLKIVDSKPHGEVVGQEFSNGTIYIDKKIDEALYEEGLLNEVTRRIQMMRKEAQLVEQDGVVITLEVEKEFEAILKKQEKALKETVNATLVKYSSEKKMNEYTIDGRLVKIAIKKE
jgi:isoleucyl-tRNA synthetase